MLQIMTKKAPLTQRATHNNAQQQCTFESPVKQNQSPESTRQLAAIYL